MVFRGVVLRGAPGRRSCTMDFKIQAVSLDVAYPSIPDVHSLWLAMWWLLLGLQMAQQVGQLLLVLVVMLPPGKVANMAFASQVSGPCPCGYHYGLIQSNGKQHQPISLCFLLQCCLDFKAHPCTSDGVLRQDEQQLIIHPDGFVEVLSNEVIWPHVMGSIPAPHALALQIGIQSFCTRLVFASIADKAGVVLDGWVGQGMHVLNKGIRCASATKEFFWNVSLREENCIDAQWRWATMSDRFKSFHVTKVMISQDGCIHNCLMEIGSAEVGSAKVGLAEPGFAKVSLAEVSFVEDGSNKVGTSEVGSDKGGPAEGCSAEIGSAEIGSIEGCSAEGCSAEIGRVEGCSAEVGFDEVCSAEVGSIEVCSAEVGFAEIRSYLWTPLSPSIPSLSSLFEYPQMFSIRHAIHLFFSELSISASRLSDKSFAAELFFFDQNVR